MAQQAFKVRTELNGSKAAVQCSGELDMASADDFRKACHSSIQGPTISALQIDFSELDFMDSAGIGVLAEAYKAAQTKNIQVEVFVTGQPLKVLQIAGLTEALGISPRANAV